MKHLTYAVSKDDGMVYSRCDDEIAYPVLQYNKIGAGGDFTQPFEYALEKTNVYHLAHYWRRLRWTKKIPVDLKNRHREFWGMKPLAA